MDLTEADFNVLVFGPMPVSADHRSAMADFLPAARAAVEVHASAAVAASMAGFVASKRDEALMLLSCHTLNLFLEFVGCVMRGRFDAASYLARPIHDAASLLRYASGDEEAASALLRGRKVPASTARIAMVKELRSPPGLQLGKELADEIDRFESDNADAANHLAHLNLVHLDKLVEASGDDRLRATIGGRVDPSEAARLLSVAVYCELLSLTALRTRVSTRFGDQWTADCEEAISRLEAWMRSTGSAS